MYMILTVDKILIGLVLLKNITRNFEKIYRFLFKVLPPTACRVTRKTVAVVLPLFNI